MFTLLCVSFIAQAKQLEGDKYYRQAIILYEQGKQSAFPLLEKAANSGNTDAMCLLGDANSSGFLRTAESERWYKMALEKEAPCGYVSLLENNAFSKITNGNPDKNLEEQFIIKTTPKAENKDIKAIKMLSYYYGTRENSEKEQYWAEKAAELGDAAMMKTIAGMIKGGYWGWYILPSSKEKAVKEWMLKSAEHGNPRAIDKVAGYALDSQDYEGALKWFEKGRELGNANSIMNLADQYLGIKVIEQVILVPEKYRNKVLGYSCYYSIVQQMSPTHQYYVMAKEEIDELLKNKSLTEDDIKKGQQIAKEWMKTHQVRDWSVEFGVL
jgi:TPR repeat protein